MKTGCFIPQVRKQRRLTRRSRRGPTASHQARATGTQYIVCGPGLASCRRPRLTSNVRQRAETMQYASRVSACRRELNSHKEAQLRKATQLRTHLQCLGSRNSRVVDLQAMLLQLRRRAKGQAKVNDMAPLCQIDLPICVATTGLQPVRGTAANSCAFSPYRRWRLEDVLRNCRTRRAGGNRCSPSGAPGLAQGQTPWARQAQLCLTPRSRRGPTASHQARATGTQYIIRGPGLVACRWSRLNSNVRPRGRQRRRAGTGEHRKRSQSSTHS